MDGLRQRALRLAARGRRDWEFCGIQDSAGRLSPRRSRDTRSPAPGMIVGPGSTGVLGSAGYRPP